MPLILGLVALFFVIVAVKAVFLFIAGNWVAVLLWALGLLALAFVWTWIKEFARSNREGRKLFQQQQAELRARAVNQNTAYMEGHDRGLYGEFPPAKLD
ncbi:ABC-type transport system involved in cytochrome bd biosynthesis fused ATPase/permease subunit [Rhodococcus sp. 27YEA15]|uniref:hypothetical protein n=1 Tax=Rhodococcus sp. 27YEA15 TaxID=3156259 RepID=UPI003C7A7B5A